MVTKLVIDFNFYIQVRHNNSPCYLINKRHGSRMLNRTSYRKVYLNKFLQNYWGCDMGMIILDLHGGC